MPRPERTGAIDRPVLVPDTPRVSVVIPVYNAAQYVGHAIESILGQSFSQFELIVVDDGSRDRSAQIAAEFARRDSRVRVVSLPHGGIAHARNAGCAEARGGYVAMLDADDIALPNRLALQVAFLDEHENTAVLGGAAVIIDDEGRRFETIHYPLTDDAIRACLFRSSPFVHSAATIRATALKTVGGYRTLVGLSVDYDLWLRLSESYQLANLAEEIVCYRVHPAQVSIRRARAQACGTLMALAAARMRSDGSRDPIDVAAELTETLAALGVDEDAIVERTVSNLVWYARWMRRVGYGKEVREVLDKAESHALGHSSPSMLLASVVAEHATDAYVRRRPLTWLTATFRSARMRRHGFSVSRKRHRCVLADLDNATRPGAGEGSSVPASRARAGTWDALTRTRAGAVTYGTVDFLTGLIRRLRASLETKEAFWRRGLAHEAAWWKRWIVNEGRRWPDEFRERLDPETPLREELILALLPHISHDPVRILDVGAGPATSLGKVYPGRTLQIVAVDPLADEYAALWRKCERRPPVPTERGAGERLVERFGSAAFDIAYARNALDHTIDPLEVVTQMLNVVGDRGYVVLRHRRNEAANARYRGLHQWNLVLEDDDLVVRRPRQTINVSAALADRADFRCRQRGETVTCVISKRPIAGPQSARD